MKFFEIKALNGLDYNQLSNDKINNRNRCNVLLMIINLNELPIWDHYYCDTPTKIAIKFTDKGN